MKTATVQGLISHTGAGVSVTDYSPFQEAINKNLCKMIFVPSRSKRITSTLLKDFRWSVIAEAFSRPVVQSLLHAADFGVGRVSQIAAFG